MSDKESLPYAGTVDCQFVWPNGFPCLGGAISIDKLGKYMCGGHTDLCLIAGLFDKPLPKMPEAFAIMYEAFE